MLPAVVPAVGSPAVVPMLGIVTLTAAVVGQGVVGWIGLAVAFVMAGMLMPRTARRAGRRAWLRAQETSR